MAQEDFYTTKEAEDAIGRLGSFRLMQIKRFADAAKLVLNDLEMTSEELISEAVTLTLEGKRRWNKKLPIENHLIGVMKSLASDQRRTAASKNEICEADFDDADVLIKKPSDIQLDEQIYQINILANIVEHFQDDMVATLVLMGLVEAETKNETLTKHNVTPQQYDAARKRISRWVFTFKTNGGCL